MVGIKNTVIGLAAAVGMMQMAPAPIAIPIEIGAAIAGGATAGAIGGAAARRRSAAATARAPRPSAAPSLPT